jgi:hypothetical protein
MRDILLLAKQKIPKLVTETTAEIIRDMRLMILD